MRDSTHARLRAGALLAAWVVGLALVPALLTRVGGLPSPGALRAAVDLRYLPPRLLLQAGAGLGWVAYAYVLVRAGVDAGLAITRRRPVLPSARKSSFLTAHLAALVVISVGRLPSPAMAPAPAAAPPAAMVLADVAVATPAPVPAASAVQHLVVADDNLWDLATDYYGRGEEWPRIWDVNRAAVPDPYDLPVGVVLSIPDPTPDGTAYTVRPGDSLWKIAEDHLGSGAAWDEIWQANRDRDEPDGEVFVDPSLIEPGWQLDLPGYGPAPSGTGPGTARAVTAPPAPQPSPAPAPAPSAHSVPTPASPEPVAPAGTHASASAPAGVAHDQGAPRAGEAVVSHSALDRDLGVAGTLLAAGVAGAVWRRRRRRELRFGTHLRRARPAAELEALRAEVAFDADTDHVAVLNAALSEVAVHLGRRRREERVRVVQSGLDAVEVALSRPFVPAAPGWRPVASGSVWVREGSAEPDPVDGPPPHPALVSVGVPEAGRQLYLDLEAEGLVSLGGEPQAVRDLARSWVLELSLSPLASGVSVVVVGTDILEPSAVLDRVRFASDWPDVAEEVTDWIDQSASLLAARRWPSPPAGRATGRADADLGCLVVLTTRVPSDPTFTDACQKISSAVPAAAVVVVGDDVTGATKLHVDAGEVRIPSLGLVCRSQAVDADAAADVVALLEDADRVPTEDDLAPEEPPDHELFQPTADVYRDPDYDVLVRLLGEIGVIGGSKPLTPQQTAVVSYIALHGTVTADAVEDAIWVAPTENRRKRLGNTISDCRTALGAMHLPMAADGRYRVGPRVVTDTELFQRRIDYAQHQEGPAAVETLRGALALVDGAVFSYRNAERHSYVWVDLESWHSDWEHRVMNLVSDLGRRYLDLGDTARAIWVGEQGRRASKTAPEPRKVLMEAHLAAGSPEAAISEYEAYKSGLEGLDFDEVDPDLVILYKESLEARHPST